jgi:cytochrome P450
MADMTLERSTELDAVDEELTAFFDDPSQFPDPYPMFRRLRDLEPVHWSSYDTWVVTGFSEAEEILLSPVFAREASAQQQFRHLGRRDVDALDVVHAVDIQLSSLINRDPPAHTRLRRLVARAFTPRAVASWQPRIEAIVDELIDAVAERDSFDLLRDLAYPLPQTVICELLGVPVADVAAVTSSFGHAQIMTVRGDGEGGSNTPEEVRRIAQAQAVAQVDYFREVIADRRRNPRSDLISVLVEAEEEGDRLSMDELIGTVTTLIGAGHETTANLVGNGMLALLRHPDQYRRLREQPDLLPRAMEEVLRHESPSRGQPRVATERFEVGGKTIEAGQQAQVILNAVNRDPRVYERPDEFDIFRPEVRHLTFTAGIHYCLGASLARAEASAMFRAIIERLGDLRLATEEIHWRSAYIRGLVSLPVERHASAASAGRS